MNDTTIIYFILALISGLGLGVGIDCVIKLFFYGERIEKLEKALKKFVDVELMITDEIKEIHKGNKHDTNK